MLDSQQEARVLKGAISRGWLSEAEVVHAPPRPPPEGGDPPVAYRYSPKLDYLLQTGRLKEAALAELLQETRDSADTADPRADAGTTAPPQLARLKESEEVVTVNAQAGPPMEGEGLSRVSLGNQSALAATLAQWDRYQILNLLGRGGNGVVYKALDRRLNRTVALKFIHDLGSQTAQLLMREARAQARIDHPGVCKVHEVGEFADQLYISMEYLAGESLQDAQHAMTLEEKVYVIKDVAEALHAAHQLGIIHRDIKPAKVSSVEKSPAVFPALDISRRIACLKVLCVKRCVFPSRGVTAGPLERGSAGNAHIDP